MYSFSYRFLNRTNGKIKHFSHQIFFHGNFPGEEKSLDGAAYGNSMDDEFLMLSEKKCTHATWENVISTIEAVTANKT